MEKTNLERKMDSYLQLIQYLDEVNKKYRGDSHDISEKKIRIISRIFNYLKENDDYFKCYYGDYSDMSIVTTMLAVHEIKENKEKYGSLNDERKSTIDKLDDLYKKALSGLGYDQSPFESEEVFYLYKRFYNSCYNTNAHYIVRSIYGKTLSEISEELLDLKEYINSARMVQYVQDLSRDELIEYYVRLKSPRKEMLTERIKGYEIVDSRSNPNSVSAQNELSSITRDQGEIDQIEAEIREQCKWKSDDNLRTLILEIIDPNAESRYKRIISSYIRRNLPYGIRQIDKDDYDYYRKHSVEREKKYCEEMIELIDKMLEGIREHESELGELVTTLNAKKESLAETELESNGVSLLASKVDDRFRGLNKASANHMLSEWRDVLYNELYAKKSEVRASEKSLVDALHQIITTSFSKPVSEYGCSAPFNFGDNSEIKTVNDFIYELDVSGIPHVKSCILEGVTPEELIKALLEARKTVEEYLPTVTIKKYVSRNPETDIYKRTIELGFNPDCPSFLSDYKRVQDIEQLIPDDNSNFFSDYVSRDENGFFRINDSMSQEEFEATVTNTIRKRK